ncbi:hypothetical protein [Falsiroseomonas tokyonensis]|uniref:Uncharacterized protein n=1 Tax=Falsiroseomonas tokyonensis TaxID=430521 RepID=A0ABV7C2C1_9PROT|nr:hypothetical protein [Falsiroseomonas tokyonensis]MBU8540447.1 hypothetical protein [Falsiroseomonas tokyonensis]
MLNAKPAPNDAEATDRTALILILEYVEAECRRLGADAAARHAALAAAMMPGQCVPPGARLN